MPGERVHPGVKVTVATLDKPIGVHHDHGAARERHSVFAELLRAHAERRTGRLRQPAGRVSGSDEQWWEVAGVGVAELAQRRVIDTVDARDELVVTQLADDSVQLLEHLGGRKVKPRVRADRRAQLAHQTRRADPPPGDVADDERRASGTEIDRVVPVAADARPLHPGLVVRGDLQMHRLKPPAGEQAALQRIGDLMLAFGGFVRRRRGRDRVLGLVTLRGVLEVAPEPRRARPSSPASGFAARPHPAHAAVVVDDAGLQFKRPPIGDRCGQALAARRSRSSGWTIRSISAS